MDIQLYYNAVQTQNFEAFSIWKSKPSKHAKKQNKNKTYCNFGCRIWNSIATNAISTIIFASQGFSLHSATHYRGRSGQKTLA